MTFLSQGLCGDLFLRSRRRLFLRIPLWVSEGQVHRCGGMDGTPSGFLSGEREILRGNIQLCLDCPRDVAPRILMAQTFLAMRRARPDILPEFKDTVTLLQKEHPLTEPVHGIVRRLLDEALGA